MIQIVDLWKSFGDNHVLKGITLSIPKGQTFVVLGGSGSGKTVLMKHVIGYAGAYVMGIYVAGIPVGPFVAHTREFMEPSDIMHGLLKAVVFGVIVSVITTWRGYAATGGSRGVGEGTTRAVVWSSVAVLVADYVITFIAVGT